MPLDSIYQAPRLVTDINECGFYHTMDIPGYGLVEGQWDLREGVEEYLGGVDFKGKRVLELGTASGFLCFHMERMGAEVIAYDLSDKQSWDLVPYSRIAYQELESDRKEMIRKLNNGFWLNHRAFNSNAKVVYGSVYEVPEEIGTVDISTFGCILLHLRDPFLALEKALQLTKETVIVTELAPKEDNPGLEFLPDYRQCAPDETWWSFSPELIMQFVAILGFEDIELKYHKQKWRGLEKSLYTVVGHRSSHALEGDAGARTDELLRTLKSNRARTVQNQELEAPSLRGKIVALEKEKSQLEQALSDIQQRERDRAQAVTELAREKSKLGQALSDLQQQERDRAQAVTALERWAHELEATAQTQEATIRAYQRWLAPATLPIRALRRLTQRKF